MLAHAFAMLEIGTFLTLDDGHNGTLLNSRGALETVSVDALSSVLATCLCASWKSTVAIVLTSKQLGLEVHLVEGIDGLIVVGLNLTCILRRMLASWFCGPRW